MKKRIGIIGATGSIGTQAVDVVIQNQSKFDVVFISAYSSQDTLDDIAIKLNAKHTLLMSKPNAYDEFLNIIDNEEIDLILHAASGVGAVQSVYDIVSRGIDIALANKESIVTAGTIIIPTAKQHNAHITPVDSEHSAIFQCLGNSEHELHKITLTASGGPFHSRPIETFDTISLSEALHHPKWSMGKKITIDSATMMNKGLELIEARYLFDVTSEMLDIIIHPQSIIHSYVTFVDGSTIAQLGSTDMRIPISYGLGFPDRIQSGADKLDLAKLGSLTFEMPCLEKFKCLDIALKVLKSDSNASMTTLNAANEVAVYAFLQGKIKYCDIASVIEDTLSSTSLNNAKDIEEAIYNSTKSEEVAKTILDKYN